MKASELIMRCLEREGVQYIFGLPGEENIDLLEAVLSSQIQFVLTRDERGAAFMANVWGRLSGRPGVCLSTLGPGATNLTTGIADAYLDFAPAVALTAQKATKDLHKESHQYINTVSMFRPITKWNTRIEVPDRIPEIVRKAFKLSSMEKPGPVHIEIPENIPSLSLDEEPLEPLDIIYPEPSRQAIARAVEMIKRARQPLILAGNGVIRGNATAHLAQFSRKLRIPVTTTFMGMGAIPADDDLFISTTGLQARDYISCGFDRADLIIAVGYDPVEFNPNYWDGKKEILHINFTAADVDKHYRATEVIGNIKDTLSLLTESLTDEKDPSYFIALKGFAEKILEPTHRGFPLKPLRVIQGIRKSLGREDILISDVGAHKIWISRFYPAYSPDTVIISNGLAAMGIGIPAAISAKLLFPGKKVIAAVGDGGFLMSLPELETARRLNTPFVCLVFNDGGLGLIEWKERLRYHKDFFVKFNNPDFVKLAESFGVKGYRVSSEDELEPILKDALDQNVPAIIDCQVDYSENLLLSEKLGGLICPM
ncbi:MAG TPA: acetolactate synthase large subunit [Thermodesulfovibrionales bacterium]|nr:acetolactate synthase large subunit [Thermodesulfovibrionales bacterium]